MKFFEGCTALITGASAGLGAEFARQLAPYAGNLVLIARRADRLEQLRAELSARHPETSIFTLQVDLAKDGEVTRLVEWLSNQGLNIDFLINNAGVGDHGEFADSEWDRIRQMIEVNITALTRLTHALLPQLRGNGRAAILNVGSIAGMIPLPGSAVYAATKAYVNSFSEALRIELRGTGVTVSVLCPGPVETEFFVVATREGHEPVLATDEARQSFIVPVEEVVRVGLEAVIADRPRAIPGFVVAVSMALAALLPLFFLRMILQKRFESMEAEPETV